jgi:arylsulfatase A-like enzyme
MNLIWIVSDSVRRNNLGAYGNTKMHTPSLDSFAAKSIRFDRHYIGSFPTMPTRADFFTGRNTISFMKWGPLPQNEVTLPQILAGKDITTAAVVDTPYFLRDGMNYDHGFQYYIENPGQHNSVGLPHVTDRKEGGDFITERRHESDYFAPATFIKAMNWLESHYKENFFLYIDTWDPHEPWDAPRYYTELYLPDYDGEIVHPPYVKWNQIPGYREEKVKKAYACYRGEITMVDTWFGFFMKKLENLSLMDRTVIIFTTDHGFYFGEHGGIFGKMQLIDPMTTGGGPGEWTHSPFYEEVTAIPLMIYMPNNQPGVYKGLTSAVDLMPTVIDIMGYKVPSTVEGISLLPTLKNRSLPGRKYVISGVPFVNKGETQKSVDNRERVTKAYSCTTITTDEWSLLYSPEAGLSELYNLKTDPRQEKDVIREHPEIARELHTYFMKFLVDTKVPEHLIKPRLKLNI